MKTIGLLGGMSWESTTTYYSRLNQQARERLGGLHSAELLMHSVDFARFEARLQRGAWDELAGELATLARSLQAGGAEMVLLCTNTMHKVADAVQAAIDIPLLHIADCVAGGVRAAGCRRPLLLATRQTMEEGFYLDRLRAKGDIDPLVPSDPATREMIQRVIFDELCRGVVREDSRRAFCAAIAAGQRAGADSVILGCTEIGLLIGPDDTDLPVFDSTLLHADAALEMALAGVDEKGL